MGTLVTISTLEYEYDANGQITQYTDENGNVINYSYYPNGELHTLTYPGNKVVSYTYNNGNQLETVTDWNNDVTTYAYDANGKLSSMTRPNGTVESYTYYKNDWLKSKTDKDSSSNIISEYNFAFDNVGNIVTENGNNNNITNVYSDLYELEQQVKKDDSQTLLHQYSYTYDDEGNILTRSDEKGVVDTMTYVDGNKLATYNGTSVIYDNDGNMTSGPLNGVNTTYAFDSRNQLNNVGDHTFKYDAQGRRIEVDVNGDTTEFVVNPLAGYNQILIKTAATGVSTYYVYGIGLISEETANVPSYYHFDNRGSTIALTSSNETITDTFEYGPYGELISRTGTLDVLFRYNGKFGVVTDENNLVFMMTRYYNTDIKRFVNQDSVVGTLSGSLSLNQYAFTQGNPVNLIDPKGNIPIETWEMINGEGTYGIGENDPWYYKRTGKTKYQEIMTIHAEELLNGPIYDILIWPTESEKINSSFGDRTHPITFLKKFHGGVDIGPMSTNTDGDIVVSSISGIVISTGYQYDKVNKTGVGYYVKIEGELDEQTYHVLYFHLEKGSRVVVKGDEVNAGEIIANMGTTGGSTGTHLHFEIRAVNGGGTIKKVDPMSFEYGYLDWD